MTTDRPMELGMVGLGRMGSNLVRRLMADGHRCVVYDVSPEAVTAIVGDGAAGASTIHELVTALHPPRAVWVMVPAGEPTEAVVRELAEHLEPGDVVIDGGNTNHRDDLRRARELADREIHLVDCGTSGGLFGIQRGFCLMVGADEDVFGHLEPIFASLAPGADTAPRTRGRDGRSLACRAGLPPLRSGGRRALREDGPQRHRVRPDGRVRRGTEHPRQRERGRGGRPRRCGDRPLARSRGVPVRDRRCRGGRGVAPGERGVVVAPRSHGGRAVRGSRTRRPRGSRWPTRARGGGPRSPRSRKGCPPTC